MIYQLVITFNLFTLDNLNCGHLLDLVIYETLYSMKKSFEKMKNFERILIIILKNCQMSSIKIFRTFERIQLRIIKSFEKFPRELPKLENYSIH